MSELSLKKKVLQGSLWTMVGFGASRALRLGSHLILAWLLSPQIFGIMALVKVFQQGLGMFSDIGIGPSIIQSKRGHDPVFLNTAWTIQVVRGFALWGITCLFTYPFAAWYARSDPAAWQLTSLLPVAALVTVIAGFNSTALFTLDKELRLGKLTMIELGVQLVALSVMVGWASVRPTVWAMVAGGLAGALAKMLASHALLSGYRVRFQWDRDCSRSLFTFGKWIFLSTALTFLAVNLDKLVLGKMLSLAELGLYGIAFVFAKAALDVVSRLGSAVMFPVYAKFQDHPDKLMGVALRAREVVLWVGAAVCICFALGAPLFFETLWDSRYHGAGIIARWLALYIWMRILTASMDRIPLALGNSKALFLANIMHICGVVTAMVGYWLGRLPGFIVGLAVGPASAHLFLLWSLPSRKAEMLGQSGRFTSLALLVAVSAVGLSEWLRGATSEKVWVVAVSLGVGLFITVAAWKAYCTIRHDQSTPRAVTAPEGGGAS